MIPFIVQFGLYLSPVGFSSSIVPQGWRWLFALNPMAGVIEGSAGRCSARRRRSPTRVRISLTLTAAILAGGVWYFRRTERTFADVI